VLHLHHLYEHLQEALGNTNEFEGFTVIVCTAS